MSDPLFVIPRAPFTLAEILTLTNARTLRSAEPQRGFDRVGPLDRAGPRALSFCHADDLPDAIARTRAGGCFIAAALATYLPGETIALISDAPAEAFALVVAALYPGATRPLSLFATRGISPAAFIHAEARLEADVTIDPGVVIGPRAEIGTGTIVGANTVIGPEVRIGRGCAIGAQTTIAFAMIGNGVVIAPGVRIGQDAPPGPELFPHAGIGRVIVQDSVVVGANTTIDRGGLGDTILGEGSLIGSLLHIIRDQIVPRHAILRA